MLTRLGFHPTKSELRLLKKESNTRVAVHSDAMTSGDRSLQRSGSCQQSRCSDRPGETELLGSGGRREATESPESWIRTKKTLPF